MSFSVLLCDPQYKLEGNVPLDNGKFSVYVLPALPLIRNFPEAAVRALFSGGTGRRHETRGRGSRPSIEPEAPISMLIFTKEFNRTAPLHPFPLPAINDNMNRVLRSAANAYLFQRL